MTVASSLRALVLDDDPVYRRIVTNSLQRIGITQISVASELSIALSKLQSEPIDIITIDVVLREGSGLEALTWIKKHKPGIITILVTAGSNSAASKEVDALLLGASALVLKPSGTGAADRLDQSFRDVIEGIERGRAATVPQSATVHQQAVKSVLATFGGASNHADLLPAPRELIAVGASTGGPPVIMEFLLSLPKDFRTPIVLTQHMPAQHIPHFAKLLQDRTGRLIDVGQDGEIIRAARTYVAPGSAHLTVQRQGSQLVIRHDSGPEEHNCKPAVDPMFRSVANTCGNKVIALVMTGMGADGASGAALLRAKGAPVVVQDKSSSVVWGMPGATVQKGAASVIAPADKLAEWVTKLDSSCMHSTLARTGVSR